MTLANKLTLSRLLVLPLIVGCCILGASWGWWMALALGILAALTDLADGYIARSTNTVTDFGKAMDPIADKALFFTLALPLADCGALPWALVWLFLIREFVVSGLRIAATGKSGTVIAASLLGKAKTALQDVGILLLTFAQASGILWTRIGALVLLGLAALFTVLSMIQYVNANREVFR